MAHLEPSAARLEGREGRPWRPWIGLVVLAVLAGTVSEAGARTRGYRLNESRIDKKAVITVVNRMPDRPLRLWYKDTAPDAGTDPPALSPDFAQVWSEHVVIAWNGTGFSIGSGFRIGRTGGFTGWFLLNQTPQGVWRDAGDFRPFGTREVRPGGRIRIVVDRDRTQFLGTDWNDDSLAEGFLGIDEVEALYGGTPPDGATTDRICLDEVWTKAAGARRLRIVVREPGPYRVPGQPVPLVHE